jgi:hypothetical protein
MQFYLLLTIATLLILVLGILVFRKTHNIAFPFGIVFLYYWTLYGGWFIVRERMTGDPEKFDYLYYKLFPIALDDDYLYALLLYALFVIFVELSVLWFVRERAVDAEPNWEPVGISHGKLILVGAAGAALAFFLIKDSIAAAGEMNRSAYYLIREDSSLGARLTMHQLLNRASLLVICLGISIIVSGKDGKFIAAKRSAAFTFAYFCVLGGLLWFNMKLGNRNVLVYAGSAVGLFYLANARKPKRLIMAIGAVVLAVTLAVVGVARDGYKLAELAGQDFVSSVRYMASDLITQVEPFAAHLSMYGTLHKRLEPTYGYSFASLIASVIPRAVWPDRPGTIYEYYASGVGAIEGQGYTVHHATAWYLNFGMPGVLAGAILLGYIWSTLFNRFYDGVRSKTHFGRIFSTIAFWIFTAFVPTLIRDGPEAYKALAFEALLIPTAVLYFSTVHLVLRYNRPVLVPMRPEPDAAL